MNKKLRFYCMWTRRDEMIVFNIIPTIQIVRLLGFMDISFDWLWLSVGIKISDKDTKP